MQATLNGFLDPEGSNEARLTLRLDFVAAGDPPSFAWTIQHSGKGILVEVAGEMGGYDFNSLRPLDLALAVHSFAHISRTETKVEDEINGVLYDSVIVDRPFSVDLFHCNIILATVGRMYPYRHLAEVTFFPEDDGDLYLHKSVFASAEGLRAFRDQLLLVHQFILSIVQSATTNDGLCEPIEDHVHLGTQPDGDFVVETE
jgi:hypothetical protein